MHLQALATAVPPHAFTQPQCWEMIKESPARRRLSRRSLLILQSILRGDSGVRTRHFACADPARLFELDADGLNAAYRDAAPRLAAEALQRALARTGERPGDLDALFICSCTGYLCPGVTSYVAEMMDLRSDAFLMDVVGLGCGAAVPMLRSAAGFLAANPGARVATVAVEICSAAFYLDDDPGVIVSACIFADGAAAALWRGTPGATGLACGAFATLHRPDARDRLRFEHRGGKLRNLLDPAVPQLAADSVRQLRADEAPASRSIVHPGGREVIAAVEGVLGEELTSSRAVLADYGNLSSPSVLFVLDDALRRQPPAVGEDWSVISFGAGFSAHACRISAVRPSSDRAIAAECVVAYQT
jgi:predicted naringenin-chalcone synthase